MADLERWMERWMADLIEREMNERFEDLGWLIMFTDIQTNEGKKGFRMVLVRGLYENRGFEEVKKANRRIKC